MSKKTETKAEQDSRTKILGTNKNSIKLYDKKWQQENNTNILFYKIYRKKIDLSIKYCKKNSFHDKKK